MTEPKKIIVERGGEKSMSWAVVRCTGCGSRRELHGTEETVNTLVDRFAELHTREPRGGLTGVVSPVPTEF